MQRHIRSIGLGIVTAGRDLVSLYRWPLSAVLSIALAGTALAQDQLITPNFQETDIRVVTESVMAITGRNVILDPRINARVTLFSNTPVTPEGFYELYLAALQVHGYAATESGNVVRVIPDATARQLPSDDSNINDAFVTRTIAVENVAAAQLVPILRPLIAQIAHFAAHPESNMLVISDRAGNVNRIAEIIRRMDVAGRNDFELIRLENASAGDVVNTLTALAQTAQAAGGAPAAQFVADARTNSIVLSGTENARLRYRAVIVHLDTPIQGSAATDVRYLQYADAEELATALTAQFGGTAGTEGAPATPGEEGVTIWAHQGTNALVINAPPRVKQDIMRIIDQIDIRRAQVQVDAIIVELSKEKEAELGITWVADGSSDNNLLGITNFGSNGVVQLAQPTAGDTPNTAAIPLGLTVGLGRITDTGTSWAAILNALRGDGNTNIVSTPSIIAMDNQEAEISVGQQVPFLTGQFTNTGAAAGAVNPFQTIQREDVGTTLKITPQINDGSGVILEIEQTTSSISGGASGAVDIVTNNRSITTSVFVEDHQILVLGGLIDNQLRESEQRVPFLGRIPGLGWLFKTRRTDRVEQNLFVFIRPTILRDGIDAAQYTNAKYNYIRELQLLQSEEEVPLMREEERPVLPDIGPNIPGTTDGNQP
jgi:general secretion pathway protein D